MECQTCHQEIAACGACGFHNCQCSEPVGPCPSCGVRRCDNCRWPLGESYPEEATETRAEPNIRKRAAELLDLPEGWDSYGAKRIDPESAQLAVRVAQALFSVADFRMVPMSSGGVALESHDGGQDVEITIEPADAESAIPWWEPRPWVEDGPAPDLVPMLDDGIPRIDVFVDSCVHGWFEATFEQAFDEGQPDVETWCWSGSTTRVESVTHWRPKGPSPT